MKSFLLSISLLCIASFALSQNVGIGTSKPNEKALLDVSSTTQGVLIPRMTVSQRNLIAAPPAGLMVYETTSNALTIFNGTSWVALGSSGGGASPWAISGDHIYNSNIGNVGINTASPTSKLTLTGNMLIKTGSFTIEDPFGLIGFRDNNVNQAIVHLRSNGDFRIGTQAFNADGKLLFETLSTTRMTVTPSGNVGVGYSNPVYKLDVNGTIHNEGNLLVDEGYIRISNAADAKNWQWQYSSGTDRLILLEQGVERITYKNGGNIGIGVFAPEEKLDVNGSIRGTEALILDDDNGILQYRFEGANKAYVQLSGDNLRMGVNSGNADGDIIFRMNGVDRGVIKNNGNFGIGTLAPASTLHVQGRGLFRGNGEVISVDGFNPNIAFYQNGVYKSFISQTSSGLFMGVNGGSLQLDGTQVAIGGIVPAASGYKLTVTGKAICEELKVQLQGAWPDYVFQEDYSLMPLTDLRKFIATNNHLPNIPAASTIDGNGIEVGDMQRRMMEKIEELTLYILQLEEKVNALSKKQQ